MLFDIVPDNFFTPLTAKGKIAYWECICMLFRITNSELSFGIEKSYLVDELQYYFESNMAADISDEDYAAGTKDGENQQSSSLTARDKANLMIRQLDRWGWIYIDTDMSYVQRVNFRDYAIAVIRSLISLEEKEHPEYQGFIYTIYNLVKAGDEQAGIGLLQIVDNTEALISGLKSLNANIKKYIDTLTRYSTVAEILDALLNDYYTNIIDKAYHRLMTSDNVAKFRPEIIRGLERFSKSSKYLDRAAAQIAEIREIPLPEAREEALSKLHGVIDAFRKIDQIIEDINKKNMKYQRAAINRARFLLSSSDDIRGQLKNIIGFISEEAQNIKIDHNTIYEFEQLEGLIKLFTVGYLDIDSLYSPIAGRKPFVPEPMEEIKIDKEERIREHGRMLEKLRNNMSPDKIDAYVSKLLGDRALMRASEVEIRDIDTFIRLIYIRLYSLRKSMSYETEIVDAEAAAAVSSDNKETAEEAAGKKAGSSSESYSFRDFIIKRKA